MAVRGYVRVSTDEQAKNGQSIPAQIKILQAQATVKGYEDFEAYVDDGYSGKNLNRPAVQKLLKECREGKVDVVIVWKLDRLSRSLRDILAIIEDDFTPNGVTLISATEAIDTSTPGGRAMLAMLGTFAQFEREQDAERVAMVHRNLAKDCRFLGGPVPLGFRIVDHHYAIDETTAPIVRKVFEMYITRQGYTEILRYLDACGVRTAFGSPYTKSTLNHLLTNERYAGTYIHNRLAAADAHGHRSSSRFKDPSEQIRIPGGIPAIIDMETWQAACALREEYRRFSGHQSAKPRFLLSGLCVCGVCGSHMVVECAGRDKDGTRQRYYTCKNHCVPAARKEKIEAAAIHALTELSFSPELVNQVCDIANTLTADRKSQNQPKITQLQVARTALSKQIANLTNALATSSAPAPAAVLEQLATLEKQQQHLTDQINSLSQQPAYNVPQLLHLLSSVQHITKMPLTDQQTLLQTAFHEVRVHPESFDYVLTGTRVVEQNTQYPKHLLSLCSGRKH